MPRNGLDADSSLRRARASVRRMIERRAEAERVRAASDAWEGACRDVARAVLRAAVVRHGDHVTIALPTAVYDALHGAASRYGI